MPNNRVLYGNYRGHYECSTCSKVFSFKGNLRRHTSKFHSENTKANDTHECDICWNKFTTISYLRKHINVVHQRQGKVVCAICSKVFQSRNNLVAHLRYKHNSVQKPKEEFTCDCCKRKFNRKTNLLQHIVSGTCRGIERSKKTCPYCEGSFMDGSSIRTHVKRCDVKLNAVQRAENDSENFNRRKRVRRKRENKISKSKAFIDSDAWEQIQSAEGNDKCNVRRSCRKRTSVNYQLLNDPAVFSELDGYSVIEESQQEQQQFRVIKDALNVTVKTENLIEENEYEDKACIPIEEILVRENFVTSEEANNDRKEEFSSDLFLLKDIKSEDVIIKTEVVDLSDFKEEDRSSSQLCKLIGLR